MISFAYELSFDKEERKVRSGVFDGRFFQFHQLLIVIETYF